MPVNADLIRELVARAENPRLDFKRDQYDWNAEGNNELAKDLMAIGNVLPLGAEPGFILVGVDEGEDGSGVPVGLPPGSHLDDANLHQKVSSLLNRTPIFTYMPVDLNGLSIGVFQVLPGGRPFYALRDVGRQKPLKRFEPRYRNGSATELASPDQVIAWSREDDPVVHEARALELQARKVDLEIIPRTKLLVATVGKQEITIKLGIENHGQRPFAIGHARFQIHPTPEFLAERPPARPELALKENQGLDGRVKRHWTGGLVKPGDHVMASFVVPKKSVREHLQRIAGKALPGALSLGWFSVALELNCSVGNIKKVYSSTINLADAKKA